MGRARTALWIVGAVALIASVAILVPRIDVTALRSTVAAAGSDPFGLVVAVAAYAVAFGVRAEIWHRLVPQLGRGQAWAGIHVSLGANHVLPLRLGEALRVVSATRRTNVTLPVATASTVTLRAADVAAVIALAAALSPRFARGLVDHGTVLAVVAVVAVGVAAAASLRRLSAGRTGAARVPVAVVLAAAAAAWLLESAVLWQAAGWAGLDIGAADAVLVTAVTIAAQIVAVAPAGVGTYELAAVGAFAALGHPAEQALAAAVAAHAVKTAYALVTGAVGAVVPAPGLLGHLRLRRMAPAMSRSPAAPSSEAPVLLFLPAYNEAATVGDVVHRVPATVAGRRVDVVVVDDGSSDETSARASAAGADVVRHDRNLGLGAAVRTGLAEAVRRGAAAVGFCDADGEYAPEELERLVEPLLAGDADYVVGSRFAGEIRRMLPHRRLGNQVLTRALRYVARAPISDGQSGYRALSAPAAAAAEVIHDFNYAQVLTLDLLGKGYRYAEVPISYGFREQGTSFVRLGRYLRAVIPAVHRELNTT